MSLFFDVFNEERHIHFIEQWENQDELYTYLSHTRPRYLRENFNEELKESTKLYLIKLETEYIGVAWLEEVTKDDAKLGIYIGKICSRGKGIGEQAVRYLISVAFNELDLNRIYLNVRKSNEKAIKCYIKCGFKIAREYEKELIGNEAYQGVYEMQISKL